MSTAILIDPNTHIIDEVDIDLNCLLVISNLIGCSLIEIVEFPDWVDCLIIIDEEGKLKNPPLRCFVVRHFHDILAGRGLVVGTDAKGNFIKPHLSLLDVADRVDFL